MRILNKSNPFPLAGEKSGCKEMCYLEHVGFVGDCTRCKADQLGQGVAQEEVVARDYDIETSKTLFTIANQHYKDYTTHMVGEGREEVSSWMWDHTMEVHGRTISVEPR